MRNTNENGQSFKRTPKSRVRNELIALLKRDDRCSPMTYMAIQ